MSDSAFFLGLADVRAEVQRLSTVHTNECAPLGVPHVEPIHCGTHAVWKGGAYLECQEGPLASGLYGVRIRWSRPGSQGERCWAMSPWCAPVDRLVFPGERERGETRETVGQLTLSEAATVPCSRHPGSMLADCGCKPLAEVLGEDLPWEVSGKWSRNTVGASVPDFTSEAAEQALGPECEECVNGKGYPLPVDGGDYTGSMADYECRTCGGHPLAGSQEQAATVAAPPAEPGAALKGGGVGPAGGSHTAPTVGVTSPEAGACGEVTGPAVGDSQAEWDKHRARPQGWVVACEECQRVTASEVVPDSVCQDCGGEVELRRWPDLEPNARALETIGQLEQVVRVYKPRSANPTLHACQVCSAPIRPGTRYMAPPKTKGGSISTTRRVHTICVEALARAEGPV